MIWTLFLFSCTNDEKPSNNFIDGTKWRCINSGSVYDDNGGLMYSYQEIFLLNFTNNTFTLTVNNKYDRNGDGIFDEEDSYTVKGTYKFEYPVTALLSDDGKFTEKITIGTNQITTVPDDKGKSLVFTKIRE
jgi:hypothetical protein